MLAVTTLETSGDWAQILWISAAVGAFASLVAELLIARGSAGDTGGFESPSRRGAGKRRWYDLGSFASIPIGILAACFAGITLTPVQEVVRNNVTTKTIELEQLLPVVIVAGLASSAFLRLLQERFIAVAKNKTLDAALKGAVQSFEDIADKPGRV